MNKEQFKEEIKKLGIEINNHQLEQLNDYYKLLIEWNNKINLTSITKEEDVYLKHFYDSLTLIKQIKLDSQKICDIGTGAGFPGIVLKIVFPNLEVTLVDSLNKRINFLNEVINKLNLVNIKTVHARMEEYSILHKEEFDIVTARAVAHLSNLLEYSATSVKTGGNLIFLKGEINEELEESKNAIDKLKLKYLSKLEFELPYELSKRSIVAFEKISKTPSNYPRKFSDIKKKRL